MRIALSWLKKLVKIPATVSDEELVRLIGARLVEVEEVIDERHKYDNIYVVRVAKAEKIPETHLTLCQVDAGRQLGQKWGGADGLIQVVCGAPNVRDGMLAVWLAPGAVVPASVHEDAPFVIGKRKMLKKYESNGMLAGADELDFDDRHEKIAEIDPTLAQAGDELAAVFNLQDQILDIENKSLTHRPDCFGIIGFAREVAGILGCKFNDDQCAEKLISVQTSAAMSTPTSASTALLHNSDETNFLAENSKGATTNYATRPASTSASASASISSAANPNAAAPTIHIADAEICQRYSALVLEKHGELEDKYLTAEQILLAKAGMRPIDPIVDATNYLMLVTGQPLHAFDYDKFVAVGRSQTPEIGVRLARKNEQLELLDDKQITLEPFDIVITSGDRPVALAGAMGGRSTEIDATTRKIIIESATFSLYNLRKTQMAHGIFSEAITRFTKGQPPYQTLAVAQQCAASLGRGFQVVAMADAGAGSASNGVVKNTTEKSRSVQKMAKATSTDAGSVSNTVVKITTDQVNSLLGTDYSAAKIARTLENVGMQVLASAGKAEMSVVVPAWRTDLKIPEDIIEEVGRLLGYDNIAPVLPLHQTASRNAELELKKQVRAVLRRLGANEVLTYSFVAGKLLEKATLEPQNSYRIVNSISPELQYIRQSIMPSLLDKAYLNQKLPVEQFALFEMNKVYQKTWGLDDEGVPVERSQLGLVLAERKGQGTAYYKARKFAERLCESLGVAVEFQPLSATTSQLALARPFEPKRTAAMLAANGELLGVVGEFKPTVRSAFKLAEFLAGFELDLAVLGQNRQPQRIIDLSEIEKRDLTLATTQNYAAVIAEIRKVLAHAQVQAEIRPLGIYQPAGSERKNISVHLEFRGQIDPKTLAKVMAELEKIH